MYRSTPFSINPPAGRRKTMFNLMAENTLLVRDANGDYVPAPSVVILEAARQVNDINMQWIVI